MAALAAVLLLFLAGLHTLQHFIAPAVLGGGHHHRRLALLRAAPRGVGPRGVRELLPALTILGVLLIFVIPLALVAVPLAEDAHGAAQWIQGVRQNGLPPPPFLSHLPYGDRLTGLWKSHVGEPGAISDLASHATQGGLLQLGRRVGREAVHRLVSLASCCWRCSSC